MHERELQLTADCTVCCLSKSKSFCLFVTRPCTIVMYMYRHNCSFKHLHCTKIVRHFCTILREKWKLNSPMLFELLCTVCISIFPPSRWYMYGTPINLYIEKMLQFMACILNFKRVLYIVKTPL